VTLLAVSVKHFVNLMVTIGGDYKKLLAFGYTLGCQAHACVRVTGLPGFIVEKLRCLEIAFHLCYKPSLLSENALAGSSE